MSQELEQLLADVEADMEEAAAHQFIGVAARYFRASAHPERPVSTRRAAEQLAALFNADPDAAGKPLAEVVDRLERNVVNESNWLYHPRYMGHQVSAPLPTAVWADAVVSALNQSVAVQEMSPAITLIERQLIRWLCGLAGFEQGGGTLTSGGTEATFTALLCARAALLPDAWENGLKEPLPVVLCGQHVHYAVTRAVAQLGLGLKRAVAIRSADYRVDVSDLREKLRDLRAAGTPVMAVVATAGATATGSFDDLNTIADLCEQHGVWLHVDGAHGASALLSPSHKDRLRGIERARSVAWDPHKMMLMPLSVGVLLVRNEAELEAAFRQTAPYLFHERAGEPSLDQGGRSFQCSRRADALKVWVALQRHGTAAFGLLYDHFAELTVFLHDLLEAHPDFEPMHRPESNILCFRYISAADPDQFNLRLRTQYNSAGTGWITTTLLDGVRVLRVTLINPRTRRAHLEAMVAELTEVALRLRS